MFLLKLISHEVQHSWSATGIDLQILRLNVSMNLRMQLTKLTLKMRNYVYLVMLTHNSSYLTNVFDIYGFSQLINEPTRVTPVSKTLILLCITDFLGKVTNSGVIHLGMSDHSLIFITLKIHHDRNCPRTVEMRHFLNTLKKTSSQENLNKCHGRMLIFVEIQMTYGKNGNKCLLAVWTNTNYAI